jgi:hypothetical protein
MLGMLSSCISRACLIASCEASHRSSAEDTLSPGKNLKFTRACPQLSSMIVATN